MKISKKTIDLLQKGFELDTLKRLNETEINILHKKLVVEQVKTGTISVKKNDQEMAKNLAKSGYNVKLEAEESEAKSNPWSICTAQMGKEFGTKERSKWNKKQSQKYERCVKSVKKSLKEGNDPLKTFAEEEVQMVIDESVNAKISKKELIEYLSSLI